MIIRSKHNWKTQFKIHNCTRLYNRYFWNLKHNTTAQLFLHYCVVLCGTRDRLGFVSLVQWLSVQVSRSSTSFSRNYFVLASSSSGMPKVSFLTSEWVFERVTSLCFQVGVWVSSSCEFLFLGRCSSEFELRVCKIY